jgi:hypothetical protein
LEVLKKLEKEKFNETLRTSAVARGERNIYTLSWLVYALTFVHRALSERGESDGLSDKQVKEYKDWIEQQLTSLCSEILDNLRTNNLGAALPNGSVHPYLTFCACNALREAGSVLPDIMLHEQVIGPIRQFAKEEAQRIIASGVGANPAYGDIVALAYYSALLRLLEADLEEGLVGPGIDLVSRSQVAAGGWPLGRSLLYAPGGHGVRVPSYHIGATLIQMMLERELALRMGGEKVSKRGQAFAVLFRHLVGSVQRVKVNAKIIEGWCDDYTYGYKAVDSWTTAFALHYFVCYRKFVQQQLQNVMLQRYDTAFPAEMNGWPSWKDLDEPDPQKPVLKFIETSYIKPAKASSLSFGVGKLNTVSMVLFGPPGTSKTTIARSLAKELKWPLLTLTPSIFLSKGEAAIDAEANRVFSDLLQLESVVILFDECEQLFREREGAPINSALMTGAMLPRLQRLHDEGKCIFIIATNHLEIIDMAVKRGGRADHLIGVPPPEKHARPMLLAKYGKEIPSQHHDALAEAMEGFTRDEILRSINHLAQLVATKPGSTYQELSEALESFLPKDGRVIDETVLKGFYEDQKRFCHVTRWAGEK